MSIDKDDPPPNKNFEIFRREIFLFLINTDWSKFFHSICCNHVCQVQIRIAHVESSTPHATSICQGLYLRITFSSYQPQKTPKISSDRVPEPHFAHTAAMNDTIRAMTTLCHQISRRARACFPQTFRAKALTSSTLNRLRELSGEIHGGLGDKYLTCPVFCYMIHQQVLASQKRLPSQAFEEIRQVKWFMQQLYLVNDVTNLSLQMLHGLLR